MKSPSAALLSVLTAMLISTAAAAPPVEMITDTKGLQPASTLEFRFDRPMIGRDDVGITVALEQAPVVITPPVGGGFTWLSRSSGVITPQEAWPLGETFTITMRTGLEDADGKKLPGNFKETLRTPEFACTISRGGGRETCDPVPHIVMAYNLAVDHASAQGLFRFVREDGSGIAAEVAHATRENYLYVPIEHDDWQKRWRSTRGIPEEPVVDRDSPIANRLLVKPTTALTPGTWRLEMKAGLASQDGKHRIAKPWTLKLGKVEPFDITTLRTENLIHSGRVLNIEFSHPLAPDITPETAARFLSFDPPVETLRFEGWSNELIARGNFDINREYRLLVGEDVISGDALPFAGERSRTFRFAPVKPRLYLPEITASQIQGGHRRFDVLSANLSELKVVARLVHPEDAAAAITAFGKYERENADYDNHEFYQPLPEYPFRSERIAERRIAIPAGPLDAKQVTAVDWNDVLGERRTGMVFLTIEGEPRPELGGKRPGAQALVQLTDLGVMWKKIAEGLQVTVFSLESGLPLANASVTLLDKEFKTTRQAATNAEGIATPPWAEESEWLVVRTDADTHALRIGPASEELPMYGFNLPIDYANWVSFGEKNRPMRSIVFTDRPLYRPGETVKVKGILRDLSDNGMVPAAGCKATLTLGDPRGRDVFSKEVTTDARGAFDTEITLGATAGSHMLKLDVPDVPRSPYSTGFNCHFTVADFQPDAFELKVDMPERVQPGESATAMLSARYYFGSPLDRADMRWTLIERKEYFYPEGYDNWSFGNDEDDSEQSLTLRGEGVIEGPKPFMIAPQLPAVTTTPRRGQLTVEVTDINQQTVSTSMNFTREAADFHLGAALPRGRVARVGEELPIQVIAVHPDGSPLEQPIEVNAELIHRRFETVRVKGAGNAISFRTEAVTETVAKTTGRTLIPERNNGLWIVRDGTSASFRIERSGGYHVKLTARDTAGREVVSVMPVYVSGNDEVAWDYRNPAQVELVADKEEYRPGDTARLLVKAPISGEALVTIEHGERILRRMRVKLEGNAPEIEIPLEATDAPNVFVSLMLIRGREHSTLQHKMPGARYGMAMLRVREPDARLNVEVKPAKPEVLPGREMEVAVKVSNDAGQPVTDAEVVLIAPDDGILALTGYERPQPENIFHAPFPLAIRTGLTLFDLLPEDPEALDFSNKGYLIGGGGTAGPGMKVRTDFPGTAAWFPRLRTDAAGFARVKFTAPDALTRYRLVAVAHAGNHGFGSAESSFAIRQPLMIMPGLGQHANVGDQLAARAVVRNESGRDGSVEVFLTLDATAEAVTPGTLQQRVELKNGSSTAVDFPVRLIAMGDAHWTWSARLDTGGNTLSDETVSNLKIGSAAPLLRETYLTEIAAGSETDLLAGVNPQLLEGAGKVAVTLSNTRLASLRESATHLLEYPYGCGEQIVSGLIPWILLDELRPVMPQLADGPGDANVVIQKGFDRLFSLQAPDGGIAYWPGGGQGSIFVSAYAAVACSLAEKRPGTRLPAGRDALLDFLSGQLRGIPNAGRHITHEDRALALFALAVSGRAEPAYHEELYQHRKKLSGEARAWLAMAVLGAKGPKKMIESLLDPKITSPDALSWFSSPARDRAVQLFVWTLYKPQAREVGKLVKELLEFRRNGHWGTTQNNAWALLALSRYYSAVEKGAPDVSATLVAADIRFRVSLDRQTTTYSEAISFSPAKPPVPLAALHSAGGKLFGETRFVVLPQVINQPAQNRGYAVSRIYQKLGGDGALQDAADLKVGDRLVVTLRVETARPGHFVAIDDPLPAILEAVNPAFRSRAVGGKQQYDWVSDHRETRADRVLYFCDHLSPGSYTFRYLARVRMAGTVHAGPTKAEEMYRPERFGLGEAVTLTSQATNE